MSFQASEMVVCFLHCSLASSVTSGAQIFAGLVFMHMLGHIMRILIFDNYQMNTQDISMRQAYKINDS